MEGEKQMVIYCRKSRFTGRGESVENQEELCRQYISLHFGMKAAKAAEVYEDEGFSGGNLERPQFRKMMADAEKGRFQAIVVYRLDRISRNIGDFAGLIQRLETLSVDFISIKEQFDTSSPMGRAMMFISSVFSQLERETIAERIRDNMQELAKTGRWLGGTTPTGYVSESVSYISGDGKTRKACRLRLLDGEGEMVKEIFQYFLETGSLTQTETRLLLEGRKTKTGRDFSRFAIKGILENPVYMAADGDAYEYLEKEGAEIFSGRESFDGKKGVMAYNRSLQQPGKAHKLRPVSQWIIAAGSHEPIVDGKTWIRVQEQLERNRKKSYRRPRSNQALLSGLLICGNCGNYMRPKVNSRSRNGAGPAYVYRCSLKERSHGGCCTMENAKGNWLDQQVLKALKTIPEDQEEFWRQIRKTEEKQGEKFPEKKRKISLLIQEDQGLEEEIRRLLEALKEEGKAKEEAAPYILEEIGRIHGKRRILTDRIKELKAEGERDRKDRERLSEDNVPPFSELPDRMTLEEKRRMIRFLTDKIMWDGETAHIYLKGTERAWREREKNHF